MQSHTPASFEKVSPRLKSLIEALSVFPGVGTKSATRMAVYLLTRNLEGARTLLDSLSESLSHVGTCEKCRMLSETPVCNFCESEERNTGQICVVHQPSDLLSIESSGAYKGRYFVLCGHLSPIDGIDGEALGVPLLVSRLAKEDVKEIILATATSAEGEMTAHYIQQQVVPFVERVSLLAQGMPMGAEPEYTDSQTLSLAYTRRYTLCGDM